MNSGIPIARLIYLDDYRAVLGDPKVGQLWALAASLRGRTVQMANSTAVGGEVAEVLTRLVPILQDLGLAIHWDVITGGNDFFSVTKAFHNVLHGGHFDMPPESLKVFLAYNEQNLGRLQIEGELSVIHDPQPLAIVKARRNHSGHWIWRCHTDLSRPNSTVWQFLEPWVNCYDGAIFSSPEFSRQLSTPQYLFYLCIDPLAEKDRDLEPEFVRETLERFNIDPARPILTQISRFDLLKDPVGVVGAYKIVKRYFDCQLVLAGGHASDDPKGATVLAEVREAAAGDNDIRILDLPPWRNTEINALQRGSTLIIQKSLRKGFGLTVTEGLWKKKPVVASAVGGIPTQVIHKHTGLLAHSVEGTAYQVRFLLSNPAIAARLGEQVHEQVREQFLITSNAKRYLALFLSLLKGV